MQDGHLRVFKWPSMEIILYETDVHATVKDLAFRWTVGLVIYYGLLLYNLSASL